MCGNMRTSISKSVLIMAFTRRTGRLKSFRNMFLYLRKKCTYTDFQLAHRRGQVPGKILLLL